VFATARDKARQTTCTNNSKQIMLATMQYTQDYDERFPPNYTYDGATLTFWFQLTQPYIKSTAVLLCPSDPAPVIRSGAPYAVTYMDNVYLAGNGNPGNVMATKCFATNQIAQVATTVYMCEGGAQAGSGTGTLPAYTTDETSVAKEGAFILQDPANPGSFCNRSGLGCSTSVASGTEAWAGPMPRHAKRAMVGFCDGHVKAMLSPDWYYSNTPWMDPLIGGK
jgi:prepilin-type processing-associated H-X9-DG protein